jgi:capsular exopolysaccharide synthesis family protein
VDDKLTLHQFVAVIRRWWWLLGAAVLIAGVSSFIGTMQTPRVYEAKATVMVGQSLQKPNPSNQDLYTSQQLAQTYAELAKRQPILEGAARSLGLDYVPSATSITTRQIPGTQLLEIRVLDTDPVRVCALADAITEQLVLATPAGGEAGERREFVQEQLTSLEARIQTITGEIAEEQGRLEAATSARAIQQAQTNIDALQQKLAAFQTTYASLLSTAQGATNYVSVVEPAVTSGRPVSPNVGLTVLLAAAIGLALATGGAFLIEALDESIRTADELNHLTGLPLLGSVGRIYGKDEPGRLIMAHEPYSPLAEAYRLVCSNIILSVTDRPLFSLMLTSAGPGEGKSLTLANLGVAFAQMGRRTLILDCDFRSPVQHAIFGLPPSAGLSDAALHPEMAVETFTQQTGVENLLLLSAGQPLASPERFLASKHLDRIMNDLRGLADIVLVDSPPPLLIADAAILAPRADAVVLVADLGRARRPMVRRVVAELKRIRANVIGVVMNRATSDHTGFSYHYYRRYRHGGNGKTATELEKAGADAETGRDMVQIPWP